VKISIIIPAKNEAAGLSELLPRLKRQQPGAEIIVVSDGSTDDTEAVCEREGVDIVKHPYSMGNGAAIKSGVRHASGDVFLFMDGDGQHNPDDISHLVEKYQEGYDLVVGARHSTTHASTGRMWANTFYNKLASWMTNQKVEDLTSGFRIVTAKKFREFLHLLPNGFSYPTTSTMAFFRAGYPVSYIPIHALERRGTSHISPLKDGVRFLLIIFKIGSLYSPLKLFFPISLVHFMLGFGYYLFTFITEHRFTNMSALLFITSILIFLIGLTSEQITVLLYQPRDKD
jgi:glycosyltransferase involved in cell wall biosynthesis